MIFITIFMGQSKKCLNYAETSESASAEVNKRIPHFLRNLVATRRLMQLHCCFVIVIIVKAIQVSGRLLRSTTRGPRATANK